MLPVDFKRWRQMLDLTQVQAGERFGVSRVTIQNWEAGTSPIPDMVESHWLKLRRQQTDYGPVILHYIHHLPMRPSPEAMAGMEEQFDRPVSEKYRNVGAALDRVRGLSGGVWSDFYITDEAGVMVMRKDELAKQIGRGEQPVRREPVRSSSAAPKRSPEEAERRMQAIREIQDHIAAMPDRDPTFTHEDFYDEHGLFK